MRFEAVPMYDIDSVGAKYEDFICTFGIRFKWWRFAYILCCTWCLFDSNWENKAKHIQPFSQAIQQAILFILMVLLSESKGLYFE